MHYSGTISASFSVRVRYIIQQVKVLNKTNVYGNHSCLEHTLNSNTECWRFDHVAKTEGFITYLDFIAVRLSDVLIRVCLFIIIVH